MRVKLTMSGVTVECEATESPFADIGSERAADRILGPIDDETRPRREYDKRMGIVAKHHITVGSPIDATWIVDRVQDKIAGKTVVEIGAGVGYLAVELAKHARNLTWIFDRAESVIETLNLRADVAIVVTGSDEIWLRQLAGKVADVVILPWQDYNGGKAMIAEGGVSY